MKTQEMPRVGDRIEAIVNGVWMPVTVTKSYSASFHAKADNETLTGLKKWRHPNQKPEIIIPVVPRSTEIAKLNCYDLEEIPFDAIASLLTNSPQPIRTLAQKLDALVYPILQGLRIMKDEGKARVLSPDWTDDWLIAQGAIAPPQFANYPNLDAFQKGWKHWVEAGGDKQEGFENYQYITPGEIWEIGSVGSVEKDDQIILQKAKRKSLLASVKLE